MLKRYPTARTYKTELPSGKKVTVEVSYDESTVTRPIRVFGRKLKDKKGRIRTVEAPVDSTLVTLKIKGSKNALEARSYCKPPDVFNKDEGKKIALRNLFRGDSKKKLKGKDRRHLMQVVCPKCFPHVPSDPDNREPE